LGVIPNGPDAERLVAGIGQNIQHGAENQINADSRDLGGSRLGNLVSQVGAAGGGLAHGAGELADVVLVEQAVDAAIFLVKRYQQGLRVTCLVGNGLQLLDQPGRLVGSYGELARAGKSDEKEYNI